MLLKLYFAPGTCSRVTLVALEEAQVPFEAQVMRFRAGDYKAPEYLELNPKGTVPTLVIDGKPLTENVAILTWLARRFPEAGLLPFTSDPLQDALVTSTLAWCASGLHPLITRLRMSHFFCDTPEGPRRVHELAAIAIRPHFEIIDRTLSASPWMLGDWSVADAYIYWVWFRAVGSGLDGSMYPHIAEHAQRMEKRPSVVRALEREERAQIQMVSDGYAEKTPLRV